MFTYICPKCGREVPPAYTDCPDCAAKEAGITLAPLVERQPRPAPVPETEKPASSAPQEPVSDARPRADTSRLFASAAPQAATAAAEPKQATTPLAAAPMWLMAILFAFAFLGVVLGGYWLATTLRGGNRSAAATTSDTPAKPAGAAASPMQQYVEISGLRYVEDPKDKNKTIVKFVLTNHSDADLPGVSGNVTLLGRTQNATVPEGTFSFTADLPPGAVKDLSAPLDTKKMIYELPDWQNASADLQIMAPGAGSAGSPARR